MAPEHTLSAYDIAVRSGAHHLELDIQMTRDGVLVAMHDGALDRTLRGDPCCSGNVSSRTLAEIRSGDAGRWFNERFPALADPAYEGLKVPTLAETFLRYGRTIGYFLEVKNATRQPRIAEAVASLLRDHGAFSSPALLGPIAIGSFSGHFLRKLNRLEPALSLVQLFRPSPRAVSPERLEALPPHVGGIGVWHRVVDERFVQRAHDLGLTVQVYTVNDPRQMLRLRGIGVDGIFTDLPGPFPAIGPAGFDAAS